MGANLINQVCEALKPRIEELTGERVGLCILSNLVDTKLACAEVVIRNVDPIVGKGIEEATLFAKTDPYRAATHNKGVLNGIDPILIATGNDWRAVEAGVHAYATRRGRYQPVTDWKVEGNDLVGRIEVPLAVGTVGGVTRLHPTAKVALKMLGVSRAEGSRGSAPPSGWCRIWAPSRHSPPSGSSKGICSCMPRIWRSRPAPTCTRSRRCASGWPKCSGSRNTSISLTPRRSSRPCVSPTRASRPL